MVVQCTLIGSMLSNLLLVLGTSFVYGGLYYKRQVFNEAGAKVQTSLLLLGSLALTLPTLYATLADGDAQLNSRSEMQMSRFGSVLLLFSYGAYLYFQLMTHSSLFEDPGDDDDEEPDFGFWPALWGLAICTV